MAINMLTELGRRMDKLQQELQQIEIQERTNQS